MLQAYRKLHASVSGILPAHGSRGIPLPASCGDSVMHWRIAFDRRETALTQHLSQVWGACPAIIKPDGNLMMVAPPSKKGGAQAGTIHSPSGTNA